MGGTERMIGLIRADVLNFWAGRVTAPGEFPRLIRLLIRALAGSPKLIYFPADEAIRLSGYDGQLELSSSVSGLPEGLSVWELGTNENVKGKANEDYEKRTQDPKLVDQKNTSYVFVTPRKWPGKADWAKERSAEGHWKKVLAFDAEDLVQWLEAAPAVALWFGQLAGQVPEGARSLMDVVAEYRLATNPEFDPAGTLVGRDAQREALVDMLESDPRTLELEALTDQEGATFVGACIQSMPTDRQDGLWARAIWLEDARSFRAVASFCEGHLLVLATPITTLPAEARRHWVIRINAAGTAGRAEIVLGEQPIVALIDYVEGQGVDRNDAFRLCYDAAANLERVRRGFMVATPSPPTWSSGSVAPSVAVAILIGAWDEASADDQAILAEIAGVPYAQFASAISAWTQGADPLLTRAGSEWKVHDRLGAWRRLEPYLVTRQLEALAKSTETVLLETDPRFDLAPEDRWLANMHGKHRRFSSSLRQGLAEALVIMAVKGDEQQPCHAGVRPQDRVSRCIHSIFRKQTEDLFWCRIRGELKEIAEASPDIFLDGVEKDLSADDPQILALLEEEGEHGGCLHADLLWALETLAWSAAHVGRVARVLASLAARDPGGRYSNRPANSLAAMFDASQPQCAATAEERYALIATLAETESAVTAALCERILSRDGSVIHLAHKPVLRQWAPAERLRKVLVSEYWADVQAAAKQLLLMADGDPGRWAALLANLNRLVPDIRALILSKVERWAKVMEPTAQIVLRHRLRKLLHHHNQFRGREKKIDWVYEDEILERLQALYLTLTPDDLIQRNAWLFDFHVERPMDVSNRWQDEQTKVENDQLAAAEQLVGLGIESIVGRIKEFQNRRALGYALGSSSAGIDLADALFRSYAEIEVVELQELIQGFAAALFAKDSEGFFARWITAGYEGALSERGVAALLLGLPCKPVTWDAAEQRGPECDRLYWCNVLAHLSGQPAEVERAARKLLAAGRALDAIDILAANIKTDWLSSEGDVGLALDSLRAGIAASNTDPRHAQRIAYDIATLLKGLSRSGKLDDIALTELEWAYFSVLEYQSEHELVIYKRLIADPVLLVDLLALFYIPEGNSKELRGEATEQDQRRALQAWRVLNGWRPFEKVGPQEMPTCDAMIAYAEKLRAIAKGRGFTAVAEDQLGRALSSCPAGIDGIWPHEVARQLIERLHSPKLCDGFVVGKQNARGVTIRGIGEGGMQERELGAQYRVWQKALAIRFPKTSALVGQLAEHFERDAHWMDVEDRRRH